MSNLYKKLAIIQSQIKGLSQNKQGNGYKYVTGNKILDLVKPIMIEQGLILKQEIVSIDNTRMDYTVSLVQDKETLEWKGKPKTEILTKVMMKFTWIDIETGEKDENSFGANGQNDWEKGLGSALTYAERYFLLKYFHIETDEDDIDNPDRKEKETSKNTNSESKKNNENKNQENKTNDYEDVEFNKIWNELTEDKKEYFGNKFPNKYNKTQKNPNYFKKVEKESILKEISEIPAKKELTEQEKIDKAIKLIEKLCEKSGLTYDVARLNKMSVEELTEEYKMLKGE